MLNRLTVTVANSSVAVSVQTQFIAILQKALDSVLTSTNEPWLVLAVVVPVAD